MMILRFGLFLMLYLLNSTAAFEYGDSVYDTLLKYSYLSRLSYCIDDMLPDHNLSQPVLLDMRPITFLQSGFDEKDHYNGATGNQQIELHVANMVYPESIHQKVEQNSKDGLHDYDLTHSEGFFSVEHLSEDTGEGVIVLSFKGKTTSKDFWSEINMNLVEYVPIHPLTKKKMTKSACVNCKVHKTTFERFKTLKRDIFHGVELLTEAFPNYKLVVTGHSTGGSLAMIAGLELALLEYDPLVITYGNPKIFNRALSDYVDVILSTDALFKQFSIGMDSFAKGLLRVVHQGDYIPLLPPGSQFVQPGLEFSITQDQLPHPKSVVAYKGKANNLVHDVGFRVRDIFSFKLSTIFHYDQHQKYFYEFEKCGERKPSVEKLKAARKKIGKTGVRKKHKQASMTNENFGSLPEW